MTKYTNSIYIPYKLKIIERNTFSILRSITLFNSFLISMLFIWKSDTILK